MTSSNEPFNNDISSSKFRVLLGMDVTEGVESCDASPSKSSSDNINDKNTGRNGQARSSDSEIVEEKGNLRTGLKRKLCGVEYVGEDDLIPSSRRPKNDRNSAHGHNRQNLHSKVWTGNSLAGVDALVTNSGVGKDGQQPSREFRNEIGIMSKSIDIHEPVGNTLNAEYTAENCETNVSMIPIGHTDESAHSLMSPASGRHTVLSVPPSEVRPLFTCQSGIESPEFFTENFDGGVSAPNSTRNGKASPSHTGLQSMSSCMSNIMALEAAPSVRVMSKPEIEIEAQSTAHDRCSWASSREQAEVIQGKPISHGLQEVSVHEHSQLNRFHRENNPVAFAEENFPKYEETDGETSSHPNHASPHFEWSVMHSSSGSRGGFSRGRFSFQKLIAGEYFYNEEDEDEFVECGKEEEECISMPVSHCPKRQKVAESIASKPNNSFGGDYHDSDSHPPSLGANETCEDMPGELKCIQGQSGMQDGHIKEPLLPPSGHRVADMAANSPFSGGEYVAVATNQTAQYGSQAGDVNAVGNQILHDHKPVKPKIKVTRETIFNQDCLPSNTMPKERNPNAVHPSSTKMLLSTGLLDGCSVRYKYRGGEVSLPGTIQQGGILCGCGICKGQEVINISSFEKHAGSTAKHPSDFIFFENGKSLREVLEVCRGLALDEVPAAIHAAIGSASTERLDVCRQCGEPTSVSSKVKLSQMCLKCDSSVCQQSKLHAKSIAQARPSRVLGVKRKRGRGRPPANISASKAHVKPIPQPRNSDSAPAKTKRGRETNLHKLIFMPNGLPDGTELAYYVKGKRFLNGYKQESGICCSCCNQVVSCSLFEAHAGWGSRRNPYQSIYLSDGQSLHEVALALASRKRNLSPSANEDFCAECEDGGELLLCDGCPKAFHRDCLGMTDFPEGDWYCFYCRSWSGAGKKPLGKIPEAAGMTGCLISKERSSKRCTRIVKAAENTIGGCVLCRCKDFTKTTFGDRTVILCDQCEREFHVGCLRVYAMSDLRELPEDEWFCSDDCTKIHSALKQSLANGPENLPSYVSEVLQKKLVQIGSEKDFRDEIRWQILHGKTRDPNSKALLAEAAAIFHECFDPIVDPATGRDLIPSMVYSRSVRDQEFGGMYCAVLTVNSVVVSAGVFRIFGCQIAELPLVATSAKYQGQGYFQSLFLCIENMLGLLNVKQLVLPAAEEAISIWTNKFGFTKMPADQFKKYSNDFQIMVFKGASLLEKELPRCSSVHGTSNMAV